MAIGGGSASCGFQHTLQHNGRGNASCCFWCVSFLSLSLVTPTRKRTHLSCSFLSLRSRAHALICTHTHTIEFAFSYNCGCVLTRSELLHTAGGSQTNATRRARSWHAYNFTLSPITLDRRCCHGRTSGIQSDAEFQPPAAGGRRAPKKCDRVY